MDNDIICGETRINRRIVRELGDYYGLDANGVLDLAFLTLIGLQENLEHNPRILVEQSDVDNLARRVRRRRKQREAVANG